MISNVPRILAIIPARAGSKGVPNKNFRSLAGRPLIHYTCESAAKAQLLDTIVISTDYDEAFNLAKPYSTIQTLLLRPANLAQDDTPMIDVVTHVTRYYDSIEVTFDYICLLQPTCPFRMEGLIDRAINLILSHDADSLATVRQVPAKFNPHWAYEDKNGYMTLATGEKHIISRRQDLPVAWYRDGQIYITRMDLIRRGTLLGEKLIGLPNEGSPDVNIDTMEDWLYAENIATNGYSA